jgi:serine/threonine-protein phosphatase 2B catalytic subunit
MHRWDGPQSFPYVITIFSAPNYCGSYENKAAVLIVDKGNLSLKQYEESDQPYRLPDNLDVFSWSMPFLAEKVTTMLCHVIQDNAEEDLPDSFPGSARDGTVRAKVKTIARLNRMFTTLREE